MEIPTHLTNLGKIALDPSQFPMSVIMRSDTISAIVAAEQLLIAIINLFSLEKGDLP